MSHPASCHQPGMVANAAKHRHCLESHAPACRRQGHLVRLRVSEVAAHLQGGEGAKDHSFRLCGQLRRHVSLVAPQQVGPNAVAQNHGALERHGLRCRRRRRPSPRGDWGGKRRLERGGVPESSREHEVHKRPQLAQVVLHRAAGEGQPVRAAEGLDNLCDLGRGVADGVGFVQHDVLPAHTRRGQQPSVLPHSRVSHQHQVIALPPRLAKSALHTPAMPCNRPARVVYHHHAKWGVPHRRLAKPVR
mmetsp:Transcript_4966/g.21284  ORF Transcript_4966/g.21284 Transcript_4966/m.21284 type:complete len:247 (+) Transcript_4966:3527-4267(+)